jgi:hypothetical protein
MMKLMDKCDKLDENLARALNIFNIYLKQSNDGNSLLDGIVPGTNTFIQLETIIFLELKIKLLQKSLFSYIYRNKMVRYW